jgi:YbgC/YbaW family acyl-CoA thioester hydrolase
MQSVEIRRRIRWADSDAAGRLYFPRIFDYVGEAEAELMRKAAFARRDGKRRYDFPRVHVECQFHKVLALDDAFILRLTVAKLGRTSIGYAFEVRRDDEGRELAAEGSFTIVVLADGNPVEIPPPLRAALAAAPDPGSEPAA